MFLSLILKINGNVGINFDDFEDVRDHPLVEPFLHTFEDVFEKVVGDTPDNAITNNIAVKDNNYNNSSAI